MSMRLNSKEKPSSYKIAVLIMPAWGHINPIAGIIRELLSRYPDATVLFYGNKENQALIEATGASFRLYAHFPIAEYMLQLAKDNNEDIADILDPLYYMRVMSFLLPDLVRMLETDQPDMLITEPMGVHVRYLRIYMAKHATASGSNPANKNCKKKFPLCAFKNVRWLNLKNSHFDLTLPFNTWIFKMRLQKFTKLWQRPIFGTAF